MEFKMQFKYIGMFVHACQHNEWRMNKKQIDVKKGAQKKAYRIKQNQWKKFAFFPIHFCIRLFCTIVLYRTF